MIGKRVMPESTTFVAWLSCASMSINIPYSPYMLLMLQREFRIEAMTVPRQSAALALDYPDGHRIAPHCHDRVQLVHASEGVLEVTTPDGIWMVPPGRAVRVPAGAIHSQRCHGAVAMRTLYIDATVTPWLYRRCAVVVVPALLRELILYAVRMPALYDEAGPDGRIAQVILDQLRRLSPAPLYLIMPRDARARRVADALIANPGDSRPLAAWADHAGASGRTLARLFKRQTGLGLNAWRQRARLLAALTALAAGASVTTTALRLGYDSPSAFIRSGSHAAS